MPDKPSQFTVTDRRKFTMEGELRDDAPQESAAEEAPNPEPQPQAKSEPNSEPAKGPRLVTPSGKAVESASAKAEPQPVESEDQNAPPELSAQDQAAAHQAYQQSSDHIETLLRAANPSAGASAAVTIETVIQSIYLSAIVALGAATEPGDKPRIDIIGARQSIDMLGVLQEKTRGNLNEKEDRLLQNALFEVRMMFLEVTNAIAQQAQRPPKGKK